MKLGWRGFLGISDEFIGWLSLIPSYSVLDTTGVISEVLCITDFNNRWPEGK